MSEKKQKIRFGSVVRIFLIVIFGATFLFSGYQVVSYLLEDKKQSDTISSIIELGVEKVVLPETDGESFCVVTEENREVVKHLLKPDIKVDFSQLKIKYPDLVGWLYRQDGKYHHPVMQSDDNDFYLRRLPNGKSNRAGSFFLDFRNASDLSDWNHFIYGHNMSNGSMFGELMKYEDPSYYEEHPYLFYFTEKENYRLEIFAGLRTTTASDLYQYPDSEEKRNEYLNFVLENSAFESCFGVSVQDRILVLSTCSSSTAQNDKRFILFAKLVPLDIND